MDLYVLRHGQTSWNINARIQGQTDIPLNDTGLRQAEEARQKLAGIPFDNVYSSPLARARQTAEVVCRGRGIPLFFDARLQERGYGELEGVQRSEFPYDRLWEYSRNLILQNVEPVQPFFARVYGFLDELLLRHPGETVLLVTHTGVLKAVECYANGMLPDEKIGPFIPENARCSLYRLKEDS